MGKGVVFADLCALMDKVTHIRVSYSLPAFLRDSLSVSLKFLKFHHLI